MGPLNGNVDTSRTSGPEGHPCGEQIHGPVHEDQAGEGARAQIDELDDHDQRDELEEAEQHEPPVEDQGEQAMLERPPEPDHRHRDPGLAGQGLESGGAIGLVNGFFGGRPDEPEDRQAVVDSPTWQMARGEEARCQTLRVEMGCSINQPGRKRPAAPHDGREEDEEEREAPKRLPTKPGSTDTEKVNEPDTFRTRLSPEQE